MKCRLAYNENEYERQRTAKRMSSAEEIEQENEIIAVRKKMGLIKFHEGLDFVQ